MRQQAHRSNHETLSPEEYYRFSMYNEFLFHVIRELEERFAESSSQVHYLLYLMSALLPTWRVIVLQNSHKQSTSTRMTCLTTRMFTVEYRMWDRKWKQCSELVPERMVDALQQCDQIEFPNISVLLKLALTLPITTYEGEKSFSQLKPIKTSLRSTMTDNRLNGLAIMKTNRELCEKIYKSLERMRVLVKSFSSQKDEATLPAPVLAG